MSKVKAGKTYIFHPAGMDRFDPPYGMRAGTLKPGDIVRVVNRHGCPRANTMKHAHIESQDGVKFLGLVCTASLTPAN